MLKTCNYNLMLKTVVLLCCNIEELSVGREL